MHSHIIIDTNVHNYSYLYSAGKVIRQSGNPASFNKEASESYRKLNHQERVGLKERAEKESLKVMSRKSILKAGEKLFKKIQTLVSHYHNDSA